jgi:hypothetical protein
MSAVEQVGPPASGRSVMVRAWPIMGLVLALVANALWIGFLGYWVARLMF